MNDNDGDDDDDGGDHHNHYFVRNKWNQLHTRTTIFVIFIIIINIINIHDQKCRLRDSDGRDGIQSVFVCLYKKRDITLYITLFTLIYYCIYIYISVTYI